MRPTMHHLNINAVRAEALFVSVLQRSDEPSTGQVRAAVAGAVRAYGGRGCAERVAQEFGDHTETAVARMRWARQAVDTAYGPRAQATPARLLARQFVAPVACAA